MDLHFFLFFILILCFLIIIYRCYFFIMVSCFIIFFTDRPSSINDSVYFKILQNCIKNKKIF